MNPETGEFIRDTRTAPLPPTWPRFVLGAFYEIVGYKFRLDRIYRDSIRVRLVNKVKRGERNIRTEPQIMQEFSVGQACFLEGVTMRVKKIDRNILVLRADLTGDQVERERKQIEMDMMQRAMQAQAEDMAEQGNATG